MAEWGLGPFDGDCASDENIAVVEYLIGRVDNWLAGTNFEAVDIPGGRANIAMLTAILKECGGCLENEKISEWHAKILEPFSDPERWGYRPWPNEKKEKWLEEIEHTFSQLRDVAQ